MGNASLQRYLTVVFLCGASSIALAHNPNGQINVAGLNDPYLILLRDPVVLRELRVTDAQRQALVTLADEVDGPLWTMRNQSADKTAALFRELIAKAETRVGQTLSAAQRKRLAQYRLAVYGLKVLLRDDVAATLKLSEEQRKKIGKILDEADKPVDEKENQSASVTKPAASQVSALLSREQLERTRDVLGPPFDIGKLGFVRFKAPELDGRDGWLNSSRLSMAQLRGQVVALHFFTYGCSNCIHNYPWYRGWQEAFSSRGLTIVGIHSPEGTGDRDVPTIERKTAEAKLTFPILIDNGLVNWNAWGNSMWPTVYLIDKRGYVRYWWMGELNWKGAAGEQLFRAHIEELLAEKP